MKYLEFAVKNMSIERAAGDKTKLISGSVNFFGLHFEFDEDFSALEGQKAVEFFKNRMKRRVDLVENACLIPNEFLQDKTQIEFRVLSGNTVATPWANVAITESGQIEPEEPDEEKPLGLDYVKTPSGENTIAQLRKGENGLEYTTNGSEWESVNGSAEDEESTGGIHDVPNAPNGKKYMRSYGDWVAVEPVSIPKLAGDESDAKTIASKVNAVIDALATLGLAETTEYIPTGEKAVTVPDQTKDFGRFGKTTDYLEDGLSISWDGVKGTVSGTIKWYDGKSDEANTKIKTAGNYYPLVLSEYFKGKDVTVNNKTAKEYEWIAKLDDKKKITVLLDDKVIAILDFASATIKTQED